MNIDILEILHRLDIDRMDGVDPASTGSVVRNFAVTGIECTIMYSCCTAEEIDGVIRREIAMADQFRYRLEWKVYGHDGPISLKERLIAVGFEPEPVEKFMVLPVSAEAIAAFDTGVHDVRRIDSPAGLIDLSASAAVSGQCDPDEEIRRLTPIMEQAPETMSVFVAYADGRPVAGGKIHYNKRRDFAGLFGGRTDVAHRNHGHYIALVGARLREAHERGIAYLFIDALPTSEPIVKKRGFTVVTDTQPLVYHPSSLLVG